MTLRKQVMDVLSREPRSVSRLALEIGLPRAEVEDALRHMIRSARAAGHRIVVVPARCRSCGFTFDEDRLTRPGKCPACRNSRIFEPQIAVQAGD
jgi:predicted Zn-ribbon and HTH transcriptional regulator